MMVHAPEGQSITLSTLAEMIAPSVEFLSTRTTVTLPDAGAGRNVPLMIPSSQAYYWTWAWQDGEAEALEDLHAGRSRTFDNGEDAIRWLLSDDEEEE